MTGYSLTPHRKRRWRRMFTTGDLVLLAVLAAGLLALCGLLMALPA